MLAYDKGGRLIRIKRDYGSTNVQTVYEYGYAYDAGRRWRKDIAGSLWTWYLCGVACSAGELVEQTSDLTGAVWTTAALYLRGGSACSSTIIRRNSEYHHFDLTGTAGVITSASGAILSNNLYDRFGSQRFAQGSVGTPWRWNQAEEEGLVNFSGSDYLPERTLSGRAQIAVNCIPITGNTDLRGIRHCTGDRLAICKGICAAAGGTVQTCCEHYEWVPPRYPRSGYYFIKVSECVCTVPPVVKSGTKVSFIIQDRIATFIIPWAAFANVKLHRG